ncbi:diguanylate cyclase/phosphodiesterase (GGDEF & EAL domains) with PAS/PAC sensor(s) [Fimbriiglobus ruber]|uniref:diguanylate cyclase n=1 Tax=Fimbriiglobus ruber TaxID=1908690 RepID=A0A225DLV8_9BACT|nr:diguanylate cyclase/phosphodiesterase (GGDEF & EAL domains) with PAS/PAC sensor(s) [Fimbriiglobus ruber]
MGTTRYKCSVLVVDDEPSVLALLTTQLSQEFEVVTACSADHARRVLADRVTDIVLTDLQLPDISGIQFLDWVHRYAPRAARVLLTGTARVEDTADAINCCRVHRLVLKPWRAEDLVATLRSVARSLLLERSHEQLLDEYRRLNLELEQRVRDRTRELEQAMHQLQMKNQILEKMALTDALTGLPNRRAIELIARKELLRRTRTPAGIAFGLIDADRFKQINSQYLLCGGDHVLTWLGQMLQQAIRATDALGRVGGEEFMVVAPATDLVGAEILAERLRATVADSETRYHDEPIRVTVSVGFAVAPAGVPTGYENLRELASAALAEAKATGRNRFVVRSIGS